AADPLAAEFQVTRSNDLKNLLQIAVSRSLFVMASKIAYPPHSRRSPTAAVARRDWQRTSDRITTYFCLSFPERGNSRTPSARLLRITIELPSISLLAGASGRDATVAVTVHAPGTVFASG